MLHANTLSTTFGSSVEDADATNGHRETLISNIEVQRSLMDILIERKSVKCYFRIFKDTKSVVVRMRLTIRFII